MKALHHVMNSVQRREFMDIFDTDPKKYWDNITGFDLIKFDDEIVKAGDGESMIEAITRQWGEDAVHKVQRLI